MPYAPRPHRTRSSSPRRDRRPPVSQRGYDSRWTRLRAAYVASFPLCEDCLTTGRAVPVHEVDHVIPFHGPGCPMRLRWDNLRSRCRSCHARKTARHDKTIREAYERIAGDEAAVVALIDRWKG